MAVKLTKNELKVQKDRLKQFQRYLPTLQLKKQQLQSVVMQVTAQLERVEAERLKIVDGLDGWIAVFAENGSFPEGMRLDSLIRPKDVVCRDHNIAGVIVPVFEELTFEEISYDVADYPLWVGGHRCGHAARDRAAGRAGQDAAHAGRAARAGAALHRAAREPV